MSTDSGGAASGGAPGGATPDWSSGTAEGSSVPGPAPAPGPAGPWDHQPGPGHPAPGYPAVPPYQVPRPPTNTLALASLIVALVSLMSCPLIGGVAVYLGNRAKAEISRTGEEGAGFAQAGVIIGWCAVGLAILSVLAVLAYLGFVTLMVSTSTAGG